MPHLFMEDGDRYREMVLPEGLPTEGDKQKKLVRSDKDIPAEKVMEHVRGKG